MSVWQDYTIKHYLKAGADRDKLVLGIPTYGRSYTLFNPDSTDIGAPADGPGEQGDATREKGYLAYYEVSRLTYRTLEVATWTWIILDERSNRSVHSYYIYIAEKLNIFIWLEHNIESFWMWWTDITNWFRAS